MTAETHGTGGATRVMRVSARRIGFLSDTHTQAADGNDLPAELLDAFQGVDLIVHLGHVGHPGALDRLETVAPVLAVQTPLDDMLFGDRLADEVARGRTAGRTRVIEAGGLRIGLVHDFNTGGVAVPLVDGQHLAFPDTPMAEILVSKFGMTVEVVACANTHVEMVVYRQGVLLVNPGSPNLPGGRRKGGLGTAAVLAVENGAAELEIIDLAAPAVPVV